MADLETIKLVIRSLLISTTRRMYIDDLYKDFRNSEGYDCPYAAMGYRSFVSFLQSIPDTVNVYPDGHCSAVVTKETAHIQELVALQKRPKPKRRRPLSYGYSPRSSGYGSSSYSRSSSYSSGRTSSYSTGRSSSSFRFPERSHVAQPYSSNIDDHFRKVREVKNQAKQEEMRISKPADVAGSPELDESGVSGQHFINMWAKKSTDFVVSPENIEPSLSGPEFLEKWLKQHRFEEHSSYRRPILVPEAISSDESDDSFYERFKDTEEAPDSHRTSPKPDTTSRFESLVQQCDINDVVKKNLCDLLKLHPNGIWACVLPEKYEEMFNVSLNWNELGYDSVVQMAHDLLDIIICKRVKGGDWKLFSSCLPVPTEYCDETVTKAVPVVPEGIKSRLFDIVKNYPSGIRVVQLVQLYHEKYGMALRSEVSGFDDDESLFISIQDTVLHLRYIRKECYVYPANKPVELPVLEIDSDTKEELGLYPEEVMGPKEKYLPPRLPKDVEPGQYMELRVAEVYNPHRFWIMVRNFTLELDKLMDDLQDFYREHGDKYSMPDATILNGQCCTAMYEGEWHRALIKSVGDMVEVLYVDYGTVCKVARNELRFVHRDFSSLPIQAIRASLCGIQPPRGQVRFSREANQEFLKLVIEKPLIGLIQNVDIDEPFLELFLIDTTGEKDIHINDVLVDLNLAMFKDDLAEACDMKEDTMVKDNSSLKSASDPCSTSKPESHSPLSDMVNQVKSETSVPSAAFYAGQPYVKSPLASTPVQSQVHSQLQPQPQLQSQLQPQSQLPPQPHLPPQPQLQPQLQPHPQLQPQPWCGGLPGAPQPPPGFRASATLPNSTAAMGFPGMGACGPAYAYPYNPLLSQAMAAASYFPQVNQALLLQQMQQQQQQAMMLALYQNNVYQQSLLSAQAKTVTSAPGAFGGLANQLLNTAVHHNPSPQVFPASAVGGNQSVRREDSLSTSQKGFSARGVDTVSKTIPNSTQLMSDTIQDISSNSEQSETASSIAARRKKVSKKKRNDKRCTTLSTSKAVLSPPYKPIYPGLNLESKSVHPSGISSDSFSSCDSIDDIVVENLEDLMEGPDSCSPPSTTSSCPNIAPDLVQSVASFSISEKKTPVITNFWKTVDVDGHSLHLFNIEEKGFLSTGELARNFTDFSTCDILVRVLTNLEMVAPFKKLSRSESLPLFSALDGCPDIMLKNFDLSRNAKGSVVGSFHLTPVDCLPRLLIPLSISSSTVESFRVLKDSFNPNEPHWYK